MPLPSQQLSSEGRFPSPEIITLSVTTSPSKLVKVARDFELDKNAAQAEARNLRRKLADLTNQEEGPSNTDAPPSKRSRLNDEDSDDNTTNEDLVIKAGHQFVILYAPWLQLGEGTFKIEYVPDSDEGQRFENGDNKVQGQLQEIRKVLGARLSAEMSETWLIKAFNKGMKTQRSNTATRLRRHCAMLFGVSEPDMLRAEIRKEKFRERIGWVNNGQGSGSYSSVDVEILHKDYSGSFDIKSAFLNPILMGVFVAIIRGPTSAKELMNGVPSAQNPRTDCMARKHGIRNITPGAIAGSAILSRWALSSDDFLQTIGNNTGINYAKDFEEYLEILVRGLQKKKKSILNVFREWDQVVFPNSDSSLVGQDKETSSGLKTAMEMLEADEVED